MLVRISGGFNYKFLITFGLPDSGANISKSLLRNLNIAITFAFNHKPIHYARRILPLSSILGAQVLTLPSTTQYYTGAYAQKANSQD